MENTLSIIFLASKLRGWTKLDTVGLLLVLTAVVPITIGVAYFFILRRRAKRAMITPLEYIKGEAARRASLEEKINSS